MTLPKEIAMCVGIQNQRSPHPSPRGRTPKDIANTKKIVRSVNHLFLRCL